MSATKPTGLLAADRSLIIATAGHVDHGKTSLINHITGVDTDTLPEEKARGLSINLGYAYYHFQSESTGSKTNYTIGFVDVPGHTDFINNMLAGVGAVDAALLVVAADDGIMPQSREHIAILDLLGIEKLAVAITKIDRCEAPRVQQVCTDLLTLLEDTGLANPSLFKITNTTGEGVPELTQHLEQWVISSNSTATTQSNNYFRYLIDRSFTVKGIGTVVTGSARAGAASIGDTVLHTGSGQQTKIRGLRLDKTAITSLQRGQRAAANISLDHSDISRGDWLIDAGLFHPVSRFDVSLRCIENTTKLENNAQYHLHIGASHHIITLRNLDPQHSRYFQIKTQDPVVVHFGDRFIIRDPAAQHTIAGGKVIDIFIPRRGRASNQRLSVLHALDQESDLALRGLMPLLPEGLNLEQFALCRNLNNSAVESLLNALVQEQFPFVALSRDGSALPLLLHRDTLQGHSDNILKCLRQYHANFLNQQGISEPALSREVSFEGSHRLFNGILKLLLQQGHIKRTGTLLHLPDHKTALSAEEQEFLTRVRPLLIQAGKVPPRTRELVDMTGIPLKALDKLLRQVTKAGNLIKVAENRYYLPETIMELAEFAEKLMANNSSDDGFTVIQFRDASGIGRNLCIEILEYFDKVGFTRRDGNNRFLRTDKENIFGK